MTKAHVLVVDDEELNLEILLEYFDGEPGFTLETATDGEYAWDLLQDPGKSFDLILLDRMMPRLDGIGLLRHVFADVGDLAGVTDVRHAQAHGDVRRGQRIAAKDQRFFRELVADTVRADGDGTVLPLADDGAAA